ncbi:DUF6677 family protein [Photobacterium nomapromontoriensis]|uniref:DUF6677 family protein n=1 Tax=Photobacterium nomapromontoriensis TaxID=2910237 RepID=UPI003D0D6C7C
MSMQETLSAERIRNQLKSKNIGIFLNFILPGAGHLYAGKLLKGILLFITCLICLFTSFLVVPGIIAFVLWLWGMFSVNKDIIAFNDQLLTSQLTEPTAAQ